MASPASNASSDYGTALFDFGGFSKGSKNHDPLILGEFKSLQRLNIVQIQNELAEIKGNIAAKKIVTVEQMKSTRQLLREYTQAIQDYDYMDRLVTAKNPKGQRLSLENAFPAIASMDGAPFNTRYITPSANRSQEFDAVREMLRKYLPSHLTYTTQEKREHGHEYWQGDPPETYAPFVDRLARFILAFFGGAALLVPMIIMVYGPSLTKSLITTSAATLLFAVFLALGIRSSNTDTLAATATYAAVLVVFVGTSLPQQGGSSTAP